jgi:hypothetical protein
LGAEDVVASRRSKIERDETTTMGSNVMKTRKMAGLGSIALAFCLPAFGQGAAFTTTAKTCSSVTWSQDALQKYPTIASACQDVLQRDGKSYVKFTGEVVRVIDGGQQLTIDFKSGGVFTVSPPENMNVSINDKRTRVRDLKRGDQLSFYIPETRLAVDLFDGPPATAAIQELPMDSIPARLPEPAQAAAPAPQAAPAPAAAPSPPPQPAQAAPAPAPRPAPAVVAAPPPPPPESSMSTIGWVVLAAVVLVAGVLLIRRSMRPKA